MRRQTMYLLASKLGTTVMIVAVFAYFSATMPAEWLSVYNFRNLVEQTVSLGLVSLGLTVICAAGEMDLSVGSTISLASMLSMAIVMAGKPVWLGIGVSLVAGAIAGLANGFMRTTARIPGVLPTIGSQGILGGVALLLNNGSMLFGVGPGVSQLCALGRGNIGPVSIPGTILIGGAVLAWWILERTRYGRSIYMVGGNAQAARASGVRVGRVIVGAYILCAAYASAAGIMLSARLGAGNPLGGSDYLLDAIIAVMLGSTVLAQEQEFSATGSIIGAFFVTVVNTGMQMAGQGYSAQCLLRGTLLLTSLGLFSLQKLTAE